MQHLNLTVTSTGPTRNKLSVIYDTHENYERMYPKSL